MKIGIVGLGHVGSAMHELFKNAIIYDKYKEIGSKTEINNCDAVFVCVPTPQNEDGSCDTSTVDEVLAWLDVKIIIIRSTIPVGYTESKVKELNKKIVFQPEYYGETVAHPFVNLNERKWITLGGTPDNISLVIEAYQSVYNANVQIIQISSSEAELAKYMENAFLATKVIFCNEFYDIATKLGVDYNKVREAWAVDPRIGYSHSFVYPKNRGFGGSCLPKDVSSILYQARLEKVDTTLLSAVVKKNNKYKNK